MDTHKPDFIQNIVNDVQALKGGKALLSLLDAYGFATAPISKNAYTLGLTQDDIAALVIKGEEKTLYLGAGAAADDMVHELAHIHHIFSMPAEISTPADIKHRFITKAFREADAFARQMGAFIASLDNPAFMQREMEIFQSFQNPDTGTGTHVGACRLLLYTGENIAPDAFLAMIKSGEASVEEMMLHTFCAVLHDYIPEQYEAFHLQQIAYESGHMEEDNDHMNRREAPMDFHTREDALFFAECLRQYGAWGRQENYLISPEGYGPDIEIYLDRLFGCNAVAELEHINTALEGLNIGAKPDHFEP